jgi:hypothetical protein
MAGFSGLGLGYLGDEKKYFGEPGPSEMPGLLQGAIDIPANYLATEYGKPAIDWLQSKLSPVAPPLGAGAPVGAGVNPAYAYGPKVDTTNPIQPVYGLNSDDEIAKQVNAASLTNIH